MSVFPKFPSLNDQSLGHGPLNYSEEHHDDQTFGSNDRSHTSGIPDIELRRPGDAI